VAIKDSEAQCPWFLQYSRLPNEDTWQVKTFKDVHKCLQSRTVKKCTAKFLSKEVEATIKPNPKIPLNALKDQLQRKLEIGMSNQNHYHHCLIHYHYLNHVHYLNHCQSPHYMNHVHYLSHVQNKHLHLGFHSY
jgi:hypothetical protein